ncbi:MAG TPA: hypothetical protein VEJ89_18795 [Myxococcaceae bacterium]|nr:hypothetical protein [Myxococcaceae bacterium]
MLRAGRVEAAERVAGAALLRLTVDIGERAPRTLLLPFAGPEARESLVGRGVVVLANIAPRSIQGVRSHGMLLAADAGRPIERLLSPGDLPPGSEVR